MHEWNIPVTFTIYYLLWFIINSNEKPKSVNIHSPPVTAWVFYSADLFNEINHFNFIPGNYEKIVKMYLLIWLRVLRPEEILFL